MKTRPSILSLALLLAAGISAAGCGDGSSGASPVGAPPTELPEPPVEPNPGPPVEPAPPAECADVPTFEGTFDAVQELIFERHGCTNGACHGDAASGGLDLRADVAYDNLLEVPSTASSFPRIVPGDNDRSFLWLKLAAKTLPEKYGEVAGAPMPSTGGAISEDELQLLRSWIYGGAPESGTVLGTEDLIDGCVPAAEPVTIAPLEPPAPGEGLQIEMPPWRLAAGREREVCFASYFDVSDQVPPEFMNEEGTHAFTYASELRQDPQSHHLLTSLPALEIEDLLDESFGAWTCRVGPMDGEPCDPTDIGMCGEGSFCASEPVDGFACIGFGPPAPGIGILGRGGIGGAQQAQSFSQRPEGVFSQVRVKGVVFWNSHAFNLTTSDHIMHARINHYFAPAEQREFRSRGIFNTSRIFSANAEPFTKQTVCNDHLFPRGTRLYSLSSHTHQRGERFTVEGPDGTLLYENLIYNDPDTVRFDPPLEFDSENEAERTVHFCATYNNGVNEDGSPDIETVTRFSRLPDSVFQPGIPGRCSPVACVEGNVGAPCDGEGDDAACDSSPGAGDGWCDACRITGGESTENEMLILLGGWYQVDIE